MHFPAHWARASAVVPAGPAARREVSCWRWSDASAEEAEGAARGAAEALASRLAAGEPYPRRYPYGEGRPLREEVVERIGDGPEAVVSRNRYGALVLNTARLGFVDVDFDEVREPQRPRWLLFQVMFGASAPRAAEKPASDPVEPLRRWVGAEPGRGARVYRTAAGLRFLITAPALEPGDEETDRILAGLGCDPVYRRLCRAQRSFRARLTPKPWRCRCRLPPGGFPRAGEPAEREFGRWREEYERRSGRFATCRFVEALGEPGEGRVRSLVELHDARTRAGAEVDLA